MTRVMILGTGGIGLAVALAVLAVHEDIEVFVPPELPAEPEPTEGLLQLLQAHRGRELFEIHALPEMPETFRLAELPQANTGPRRVHGKGKKAYRGSL